ncbi:uncharacterized protein EV420DRAFT_1484028 [Desarmillaria tabescens]|uniref:Uncharacterized protein n=1 Tax=Armillaria tabescens TaxID=1929756 RepID=A0AA39MU11_ARMTA|nr:uncharacterized protein EV420DRAFT_1484028 [Desarmillaria tabescens]KAK0446597.1 hypothetical protein EV420DRAFT_1484028 [Desarmillaria tabescens]
MSFKTLRNLWPSLTPMFSPGAALTIPAMRPVGILKAARARPNVEYRGFALNLAYTLSLVAIEISKEMYDERWDELSLTPHEAPYPKSKKGVVSVKKPQKFAKGQTAGPTSMPEDTDDDDDAGNSLDEESVVVAKPFRPPASQGSPSKRTKPGPNRHSVAAVPPSVNLPVGVVEEQVIRTRGEKRKREAAIAAAEGSPRHSTIRRLSYHRERRAQLSNPVLAAKAKANAATGQAAASSAADGSSAKPLSTKGKAKATTAKKGRKPPKSKAIVEDSSDDEPPALVAIEEDTVMGNADTPCTILDTDTVSISFLAAIARTADEVIARLQQMSIDDEVEIVVNKDPSSGNIVEGRKVLPKFKKNKVKEDAKHQQPKRAEVIFLPYAEVPGMDLTSKDYRRAEAVVAKAAAHDAATQARKRPRASNDFAFNDSAVFDGRCVYSNCIF